MAGTSIDSIVPALLGGGLTFVKRALPAADRHLRTFAAVISAHSEYCGLMRTLNSSGTITEGTSRAVQRSQLSFHLRSALAPARAAAYRS